MKSVLSRRFLQTTISCARNTARFNTIVNFVPQQEKYIIERFGKYHATLDAGVHFLIPFVDKIAYAQSLKEETIEIPIQSAITSDNVNLHIDGVLYVQVVDAHKASYNVEDRKEAILQLAQTTMRAGIGGMMLDNVFRERKMVNQTIVDQLNKASFEPWGMKCLRYEIRTIDPPPSIKESMEMEMSAERKKRAEVLESEARKQSAINIAEGEKEAIIRKATAEAQAKILLAEAEAKKIKIVGEAMASEDGKEAINFQIAEGYVEAYGNMAKETTTLIVPNNVSDISSMVSTALSTYSGIKKNPGTKI